MFRGITKQVLRVRSRYAVSFYSQRKVIREEFKTNSLDHVRRSVCGCYPVEVMEDVSRVSRSEARWWDADDSHAVRDLHLFLHSWQVVWLALPSSSS